jgi:hypothetical protein
MNFVSIYFKDQDFNKLATDNLLCSLLRCDLEKFNNAVDTGTNIYRHLPFTASPFTIAIKR